MQKFEALIFSPQTEHIGVNLNLALSLELKAVNINWLNDMTSLIHHLLRRSLKLNSKDQLYRK